MISYKKILNTLILTAAAFSAAFVLFACKLPSAGGKGLLSLTLPGKNELAQRVIKMPLDEEIRNSYINNMSYELTLSGPGGVLTKTAAAGETIREELVPGLWKIDVAANYIYPFDSDFPGETREAGKGSVSVTINAGEQKTVKIPLEVLPEFAANVDKRVYRFWAANLDKLPNQNYIEEYLNPNNGFEITPAKFQWYKYTKDKDTDRETLVSQTFERLNQDFTSLTEKTYYYCEITCMFEDNVERTIETTPVVVYPHFSSEYLQDWIDSIEEPDWIDLPHEDNLYMERTVTIESGKSIWLSLPDEENYTNKIINIKRKNGFTGELFNVKDGSLTLGIYSHNLILEGNSSGTFGNETASPLIRVENGGELVLDDRVTLCNNRAVDGGGVYISEGGALTMKGNAQVCDNSATVSGGGVYIAKNSFFTMEDEASVHDNSAGTFGSGVFIDDSTFTMKKNSKVYSNTAGSGHGVCVSNKGNFIMREGAYVSPDNIVLLKPEVFITVQGILTNSVAATIQPEAYTTGRPILRGATADIAANHSKFNIAPPAQGFYYIDENGNLASNPNASPVTRSEDDTMEGSLRYALANAGSNWTVYINLEPGSVITLNDPLEINTIKNLTIEGNGVTLTRNPTINSLQLMRITNSTVTINRIHFTGGGGDSVPQGGAIGFDTGYLTVKSSIFSNNKTTTNGGAIGNFGIYDSGTMDIRGCTFYLNDANSFRGGAIYNSDNDLKLIGNLFYRNTAGFSPVSGPNDFITVSASYNVVDAPSGTGFDGCGWDFVPGNGDKTITDLSFSPKTFRLFPESANEFTPIPDSILENYPAEDFYGEPIRSGAVAGAVQLPKTAPGLNYLDLLVNNDRGRVTVTPSPDQDGLVPNGAELTATPVNNNYDFLHWLKWVPDEDRPGKEKAIPVQETELILNNDRYNKYEAVFALSVTKDSDLETGNPEGTLRWALENAQDGDTIKINVPQINLARHLVIDLVGNDGITIEGNSVKLTRSESYEPGGDPGLLRIENGNVTIRRVHFTGGRTTGSGGAIFVNGTLSLESCIFSNNEASIGGAIYHTSFSSLYVSGCTFYNNLVVANGGAIYKSNDSGFSLTGNLFYQNTAAERVVFFIGTLDPSYNVIDAPFGTGTGQSGWNRGNGDNELGSNGLNITGTPFNEITFVPVDGLKNVIDTEPLGYPETDFNGNKRIFPCAPGAVKMD